MNLLKLVRTAIFSPRTIPTMASLAVDDLRGLDFLRNVEPDSVGLDPNLAFHYSPSGRRWLGNVLRTMSISKNDRIVDIGCGKGGAMRTMLDFPFGLVAGVELSAQMATIAKRNFEMLNVPAERVQIHNVDACKFDGLDQFNYVYIYNPFPAPVFTQFLGNLSGSLIDRPRPLTLIYNNPICHDQIVGSGRFQKTLQMTADWGNPLFVYRSI